MGEHLPQLCHLTPQRRHRRGSFVGNRRRCSVVAGAGRGEGRRLAVRRTGCRERRDREDPTGLLVRRSPRRRLRSARWHLACGSPHAASRRTRCLLGCAGPRPPRRPWNRRRPRRLHRLLVLVLLFHLLLRRRRCRCLCRRLCRRLLLLFRRRRRLRLFLLLGEGRQLSHEAAGAEHARPLLLLLLLLLLLVIIVVVLLLLHRPSCSGGETSWSRVQRPRQLRRRGCVRHRRHKRWHRTVGRVPRLPPGRLCLHRLACLARLGQCVAPHLVSHRVRHVDCR